MNDYSNRTIRSEEITIDVRICAALSGKPGRRGLPRSHCPGYGADRHHAGRGSRHSALL